MSRRRVALRLSAVAVLFAAVLPASSCGGSGGGGGGPSFVFVAFPPGHSFTEAPSIRVRGVSTGPLLSGVTVGGVAAISGDGFAHWIAIVPLNPGDNAIPVVAHDLGGHADPAGPTLHVERGLRMSRPA